MIAGWFAALSWAPPAWAGPPARPAERAEASPEDPQPPPATVDGPAVTSVEIVAVEVTGNEQVSARLIKNILDSEQIHPGAELIVPDDARITRARARLGATGYFSSVNIRLVPRFDGDERRRAELVVELEERPSLEVRRLYFGNSRFTPFRGGIELEERNFLGRSIHLGGGLIWGTVPRNVPFANRQQGYQLTVDAPQIASTKLGLGGRVYVLSASEPYRVSGALDDPNPRRFRTVDYSRIGGVFGGTWRVTPKLRLGADYRFERVDTQLPQDPRYIAPDGTETPIDLDLRDGPRRLTTLAFHLSYDGREAIEELGSGGRIAFDVGLGSPALGSEYEFVKLVAGGAYSFRLPWRHFITPSVLGGHVLGGPPRFERFYPGDAHDWTPGREFGMIWTTRNPLDVFGTGVDEVGFASILGRVDVEYSIPLFVRSRTRFFQSGHFFVSTGIFAVAGDAEQRRARRDDGELSAPVGFNADAGLRLETSIGTIDLSIGNGLRRSPL